MLELKAAISEINDIVSIGIHTYTKVNLMHVNKGYCMV